MKLLFDENLSHHLATRLADLFPQSEHVRACGLKSGNDNAVWEYAKANGFVIVSKDDDLHHLSFLLGAPPKVIGVLIGNCTTNDVEQVLRARQADIVAFGQDPAAAYLPLIRS